jgi:hypothetical protein
MKNFIVAIMAVGFLRPTWGSAQIDTSNQYGSPQAGFLQFYDLNNRLTAHLGFRNEEQRGLGQLTLFQSGNPRISLGVNPAGEGELFLRDGTGRDKLAFGISNSTGFMWTRGSDNNFAIKLDYWGNDRNKGRIQLYDNGDPRADLYVNGAGDGILELRGAPSSARSATQVRAVIGVILLSGEFPPGQLRRSKAGYVATYGEEGDWVALLGPRSTEIYDHLGGGHLTLRNRQGETTIRLNGQTGEIMGITKSFAMPHPIQPTQQIVYAALEGPEAGAYVRGTGTLRNGKAAIRLPEHFSLVVSEQGLTVLLTPRSTASPGLAVVSSSPQEIVVAELANGTGNYQFDYLVQGVRKGQENFQVIRGK